MSWSQAGVQVEPRRPVRAGRVRSHGRAGRPTASTTLTSWLFIAPAMIGFGVFVAYPVLNMFWQSLQRDEGFGEQRFAGLHNFASMRSDPVLLHAVKVTVLYTVSSTVLQTAVPLVLAILVYSGPRRSGLVYRTLIFLPAAISLTVAGLIWRLGLTPIFGVVNRMLGAVGLDGISQAWLSNPSTVVPTIIVVSLWQACGLYMLIFYAGLGNLDPAVLESARIDGAGRFREAWSIIVPILRPVIEIVVILNVINGLKVFDLPFVMTGGGPNHASETMSTYITLMTFGSASGGNPNFGYGSAIGVVVFLGAALASLILWRIRRSDA